VRIAIASGKGGTGKTTVAVNLALSVGKCTLVDCDVEEPNCAMFLNVNPEKLEDVALKVPEFDLEKCTYCGKCADFCMYNAIAVIPPDKLLFFPELCHACGGCTLLCPEKAIAEVPRIIGQVDHSTLGDLEFYQGQLNVGEPMATPIINRVKELALGDLIIYDAPPGNACPVIDTIKGTDYTILITEPTPFGLHDLKLAVEVVRAMRIPFGIIVNRYGSGDDRVDEWCREEGIEVLMHIPEDRRIAHLYSMGVPFSLELPEYREQFLEMLSHIREKVREVNG